MILNLYKLILSLFWSLNMFLVLWLVSVCPHVTAQIKERSSRTGQAVEAASVLACQQLPVSTWARRGADGLWHLDTNSRV